MKFGLNLKTRLGACLLFMTALCALPLSSASVTVFGADAPETASESPKIIASVIVNSLEEAWNGSERIADAMQYKELLTGLRGLVRIQFESYIDLSKPIGAVIAVDGDDVAPFIFFSLTELSSPPDLKKEPFRTLNEKELNYLLDEDNLLLITPSKFNEVVSSFPKESCLPAPSAEGYDTIVTATINVDALPEELIESVAAVLRQQFAELVEDDEIIDLQSIDEALEKYSELVDAVEQLQWRLYVDPDANLVSEGTITVDPESSLAPSSEPALTRWNAIAETPDAIFASAEAGANPDELAVDVSENVRTAIHENLLEALYVEIDDIETFELVEEILGYIEEALVAEMKSTQYDSGFAITSEPFSIVVASICAAPEEFQKASDAIVNRIREVNPELADAFDTEEVEDYKVTNLKLNLDEILGADELDDDFEDVYPPLIKGQNFILKYGLSSDALLFIITFDEDYADKEFKRIVQNSKDLAPQKSEATFNVSQLAVGVRNLIASYSDVNPLAVETFDIIANAKNVKIVFSKGVEDNVYKSRATAQRELFEALGDVIRLNLALGGGNDDEGEDLDDLFNE
jgi:hypothetical protein